MSDCGSLQSLWHSQKKDQPVELQIVTQALNNKSGHQENWYKAE